MSAAAPANPETTPAQWRAAEAGDPDSTDSQTGAASARPPASAAVDEARRRVAEAGNPNSVDSRLLPTFAILERVHAVGAGKLALARLAQDSGGASTAAYAAKLVETLSSVEQQIDDKFILTDPVFTDTVGILSKRAVEPGLRPDDLPALDVVLISHMHLDHLSLGSLDLIESHVRRLVVPEGGLTYVPDYRFADLELPTFASFDDAGLRDARVTLALAAQTVIRNGLGLLGVSAPDSM